MDDLDDGGKMGTETYINYLINFLLIDVLTIYRGIYYNRIPEVQELGQTEGTYWSLGFSRSVRAVNCCNIKRKNCLPTEKEQY